MGLGTFKRPDAGLFPFLIGSGITLLALTLFGGGDRERTAKILGTRWKNAFLIVGSLLVYAVLMSWLGFLIATFLLMVVMLKAIEPQKWWLALVIALFSSAATYIVFSRWLEVQFPRGLWG